MILNLYNFFIYVTIFFIFVENFIIRSINVSTILLFIISFVLYFFYRFNKGFYGIFNLNIYLIILYFITLAICSIYNSTFIPIIFGILAIMYYVYIFWHTHDQLKKVIDISSKILCFILILAFISLIYFELGGPSFGQVSGRSWYLFSLFTSSSNGPLRASGIFFEPGQFSFYICAICACREFLKFDTKITYFLLILGSITYSVAHFFFMFIFFIYKFSSFKFVFSEKGLAISLILFLFTTFSISFGFFNPVLERSISISQDPFEYQRFNSFQYALNLLDYDIKNYIYGPSNDLAARKLNDAQILGTTNQASVYGENPLTPIVFGGLLASWPYYLLIIYAIIQIFTFKKSALLFFGFICLTLQRPYTLEFPYTIIVAIVLFLYISTSHKNVRVIQKI